MYYKKTFPMLFLFFVLFVSKSLFAEPSLKELEKAALRYGNVDPQEVQRWKKASRLSNLLPKVSVGYDQNSSVQINQTIQDSISVSSAGVTLGPPDTSFRSDDDQSHGFDVRASWALDEFIFDRDSLSISAEARYRSVVRSQILDDLHQAYFERKKLFAQYGSSPDSPLIKIQIEQLESKIDTLTGGYFSRAQEQEQHQKIKGFK